MFGFFIISQNFGSIHLSWEEQIQAASAQVVETEGKSGSCCCFNISALTIPAPALANYPFLMASDCCSRDICDGLRAVKASVVAGKLTKTA